MAISGRRSGQSPAVNHPSWESDCGPRQSTHQKKPKSSLLQAPNPERHLIATLQLSTFTKWFALVLHTNVWGPPRQTLGIPIPIPMYFIFLRCIFSFVVRFLVSFPICAGCSSFVTLSQERCCARVLAFLRPLKISQSLWEPNFTFPSHSFVPVEQSDATSRLPRNFPVETSCRRASPSQRARTRLYEVASKMH